MGKSIYRTAKLTSLSCGSCEISFAMPSAMLLSRKNDGMNFYCPSGHCISYSDTNNDRLKRRVETLEQQEADLSRRLRHSREETRLQERKTRAQKAANTRVKNRAKAGVCLFCNRTVKQMAQHVADKHPEKGSVSTDEQVNPPAQA